jgi:hypothetical protein
VLDDDIHVDDDHAVGRLAFPSISVLPTKALTFRV